MAGYQHMGDEEYLKNFGRNFFWKTEKEMGR
jgi:hypothetical protein